MHFYSLHKKVNGVYTHRHYESHLEKNKACPRVEALKFEDNNNKRSDETLALSGPREVLIIGVYRWVTEQGKAKINCEL